MLGVIHGRKLKRHSFRANATRPIQAFTVLPKAPNLWAAASAPLLHYLHPMVRAGTPKAVSWDFGNLVRCLLGNIQKHSGGHVDLNIGECLFRSLASRAEPYGEGATRRSS